MEVELLFTRRAEGNRTDVCPFRTYGIDLPVGRALLKRPEKSCLGEQIFCIGENVFIALQYSVNTGK